MPALMPPPPVSGMSGKHPGAMLRRLLPASVPLTEVARKLRISRQTLHAILDERSSVSAMMALRLEGALGTDAEQWLSAQMQYDLAQARKAPPRGVKPIG